MDESLRKLAAEYFDGTWDLLDKTGRTADDDFNMIHMAHASAHLWRMCGGTALNAARGEWQVSHVYAVLGDGASALKHGERCLKITLENDLGDFDAAFAYEAVARAYAALGDKAAMEENRAKGLIEAAKIADEGDKTYCEGELRNIE